MVKSRRVVFCTTCRGRAEHIKQTLPKNLRDNTNENTVFVVLDYNDQDGLASYIRNEHIADINSGRLVYYRAPEPDRFYMAHAKNMAHRCGMREGADIIVTLDADNFTGNKFDEFIRWHFRHENAIFLCPKIVALGTGPVRIAPRGVAGRLAVRVQDFIKAGGYNEKYDTWRGEDVDFVARMKRMGYKPRFIDPVYLDAVRHSAGVRFKEYPHAKEFENDEEIKRVNGEKHSIVNHGNIGCGVVHRNFDHEPITLYPLPTRIFGIGFQRTGTSSLDAAFKVLNFDSFHFDTGDKARDIWDEMREFGKSVMLERYYALSDNPIPMLYKKLDAQYPGSKFVLTVRDEQAWLKSIERLWSPVYNKNRWTWDVWPISNRLHRALYGRTDFDADTFLARYKRHNAEVREYFRSRPSDLLVMDISTGAGWNELCGFLGVPRPVVPFPHKNSSHKQRR